MESLWKPPLPAGLVVDNAGCSVRLPSPCGPARGHVPLAASNERHKKVDNILNFLLYISEKFKKRHMQYLHFKFSLQNGTKMYKCYVC